MDPHSPSASSLSALQQELNIPKDATLCYRSPQDSTNGDGNIEDNDVPMAYLATVGDSPTTIEIGSSTLAVANKNRNFILVGRQAATADLRIDHKSISRKHAVLYYINNSSNINQSNVDQIGQQREQQPLALFIRDLGTKKYTKVNGFIIPSEKPTQIQRGDVIQFGTAQPKFRIEWENSDDPNVNNNNGGIIASANISRTASTSSSTATARTANLSTFEQDDYVQSQQEKQDEVEQRQSQQQAEEPGAGLTGRAKREAEIAAMMASLEAKPEYQKYVARDDERESVSRPANGHGVELVSPPSSYDEVTAKQHRLPLSDRLSIEHHGVDSDSLVKQASNITCIVLDPTGARFAVGSNDGSLRFYDFGGLNPVSPMPFTTITVQDGYRVVDACYSQNGDRLLVATGSRQPKLFDRDGQELIQFVRGDVYVTDPTKTTGHTAPVTCVSWHPVERNTVITGSMDGSVRTWDVERGKLSFQMLTCSQAIMIKSKSGRKTTVSTVRYAPSGREFVVGTDCGSIQIWNVTKSQLRPQRVVYLDASSVGSGICSLVYNLDGTLLASRTTHTCQVWNPQRLSSSSAPIMTCKNVSLVQGGNAATDSKAGDDSMATNNDGGDDDDSSALSKGARDTIAFSPNGEILCVGCRDFQNPSQTILKFFSVPEPDASSSATDDDSSKKKPKRPILEYPLAHDASSSTDNLMLMIVAVQWHVKLNQLLVATTSKAIEILFDTKYSRKGALLALPRGSLRGNVSRGRGGGGEEELQELYQSRAPPPGSHVRGEIITPNALPLFREEAKTPAGKAIAGHLLRKAGNKRQRDIEAEEESKKNLPRPPAKGMKAMAGQSGGTSSFTQYVMDTTTKQQKQIAGRDPREALFQYKEGKSYIGTAYEGNKEVILADKTVEQDEEELNKKN